MAVQPTIDNSKIPSFVTHVTETLENAGFEAFLVGGCVRDLIMSQILKEEGGREPKDWDMTTNATPEQIIPLFEKTIYENTFGTVGVCIPKVTPETGDSVTHVTDSVSELDILKQEYDIVEVTPYRKEGKYSDNRHPDDISYSDDIKDDLKRRDFTINALAYGVSQGQIIDLYKGIKDIENKVIRTVGVPDERFREDALRLLRAVRFMAQLGFAISEETLDGVFHSRELLKNISAERIRDEFTKIIESPDPSLGIAVLTQLGLMKYIVPELEEGIKCEQGGAHSFDVFEHCNQALGHAAEKGWPLHIRLAALFHDIGKPRTKRPGVTKPTFYGHEVVGANMVKKIMQRLKYPNDLTDMVVKLVRYHMFFSDTEAITLSAVRRTIVNIGADHIWDLMEIRECDRVGMKKKEAPYRLRKYHAMIEEALRDPISVSQLKVDGNILMTELNIKPGPRMGWILNSLLEEILEDPTKNTREYLDKRVGKLDQLSDTELKILGEQGKEKKQELEEEEVEKLRKKHGVK